MENNKNTPIIKDEVAEYFAQKTNLNQRKNTNHIIKRKSGKTMMELACFMKEVDKDRMTADEAFNTIVKAPARALNTGLTTEEFAKGLPFMTSKFCSKKN
ncbi:MULTISPECIES: hypothetical protein [Bacillus amyloliquefaciens group]|uniref:hypothetical protein n=1 Tax=Bacillus amyloliquefaciens group TaxID=1938374 RepID=UPI00214FCA47|nr:MULTISPECIES: hypothetical protein [Bacillus amyloliquefaciens group]MCR4368196.1 hypothetical protein [Bacillus amyloliquefaciens]MCV3201744.1 hypothetical protein [Bacillus velezensis]